MYELIEKRTTTKKKLCNRSLLRGNNKLDQNILKFRFARTLRHQERQGAVFQRADVDRRRRRAELVLCHNIDCRIRAGRCDRRELIAARVSSVCVRVCVCVSVLYVREIVRVSLIALTFSLTTQTRDAD